jgi:multimeric flavodoxin WrbA
MKVVTIYGNMRHGSTYHAAGLVLEALSRRGPVENREFFLPRDMDHFCTGCFTCFFKGEDKCPHAKDVMPIVAALMEADLILLASPVYGFDVSGQMKALLDHLCYQWLSHRPDPRMFTKVGLSVVTTAGAGKGHAAKTLNNSLTFWGAKRVFSFKTAVNACEWNGVPQKKLAKMTAKAEALARRITWTLAHIKRLPPPLLRMVMFAAMKGMMKNNGWNPLDREYWEKQGWIKGKLEA